MRLIDADALLQCKFSNPIGYTAFSNLVKRQPTIEPERKTGKWIPQDHNKKAGYVTTAVYYYPKCSKCGHVGDYSMSFCPNCGASMEGEQ